jgi:hypothetical protein
MQGQGDQPMMDLAGPLTADRVALVMQGQVAPLMMAPHMSGRTRFFGRSCPLTKTPNPMRLEAYPRPNQRGPLK